MQQNRLINNVVFALLGSLYCWSVLMAVVRFSYLQSDPVSLAILSLTVTCTLLLLSYTKRILLAGSLVLLFLGGAWLLFGMRDGQTANLFSELVYILKMIVSIEDYNPLYNLQMIELIAVLISAFVCFSLKTTYNFYLLSGFGVAMFCIALNEGKQVGPEFAVLIFVLLTLLLTKLYVRFVRKKKLKSLSLGKYLLRAIPLSLCVVLIASAVSIPFSGVKQSPLFRYNTFEEFINLGLLGKAVGKNAQFHKGEVKLGGNLNPTDTPVLRVESEEPLYLMGSVNDEYTGSSWKQSKTEYNRLPASVKTVDAATALHAYTLLQPAYMDVKNLTVTYLTDERTLFVPAKPLSIQGIDGIIYIDNAGELESDKELKSENSYTISYLSNSQVSAGRIKDFSDELNSAPLDDASFNEPVFSEQTMQTEHSWGPELQQQYLENLTETYTALPESVTQRTRDLAQEITGGEEGAAAKAEAIRDYLVENYTYSLSPGIPDDSRDFVDQFLFDVQKGYCTSFATAMTVLCRSAGIPARYVEGYAMPAKPDQDGKYLVKSRNAHAWAEVHLENYGWVKMEATPPYAYVEEQGEKPKIMLDEDEKDLDALEDNLSDLGIEPLTPEAGSDSAPLLDDSASSGPNEDAAQSTSAGNAGNSPFSALIILLIVLAYFFIMAVILRVSRRKRREPGFPLGPDAARYSFDQIIRLAKFTGLPMLEGETPLAFGRRLSSEIGSIPFEQAAADYSAQQYGGAELTQEQINRIHQTYLDLDLLVKSRSNHFRYFFHKYILQSI